MAQALSITIQSATLVSIAPYFIDSILFHFKLIPNQSLIPLSDKSLFD